MEETTRARASWNLPGSVEPEENHLDRGERDLEKTDVHRTAKHDLNEYSLALVRD